MKSKSTKVGGPPSKKASKFASSARPITENRYAIELAVSSGLFDPLWYMSQYADVRTSGISPVDHFAKIGFGEGRDPGPLFRAQWYLNFNKDINDSQHSPLVHFIKIGGPENRQPSPYVAPKWLRQKLATRPLHDNPLLGWLTEKPGFGTRPIIDIPYLKDAFKVSDDVSVPRLVSHWLTQDISRRSSPNLLFSPQYVHCRHSLPIDVDPLAFFLTPQSQSVNPHPLFDNDHTWLHHPEVRAQLGELTLLEHILEQDMLQGLDTSPLFDRDLYRSQIQIDPADNLPLICHYMTLGAAQGIDPNQYFDEAAYRRRYLSSNSIEAGLCHYLTWYHLNHITLAPRFADRVYRIRYPEVAESFKGSPLEHYMLHGLYEGRTIVDPVWCDDFLDWEEIKDSIVQKSGHLNSKKAEVAVIIPVYGQFHYTLRCVWSILCENTSAKLQIIIADDCSSDETRFFFSQIKGLTYLRNATNMGFLQTVNKAASITSARFLFLLNNDTVVLPGAIDRLVETAIANPEAGIVGAKLIYPDGTLQEAGGYVWKDGSAANAGRHSDPNAPAFNFRRDADYISGAAILVPRNIWNELGGFDQRFSPAYYEDTDFAMQVRKHGWRVLYEPSSEIVHFEGISSGTDVNSGIKSYQLRNKVKFFDKWKFALELHADETRISEISLPARGRPRLLFIDHIVPEPDRDAGSVIAISYIKIMLDLGYDVTFIPDNLQRNGRYGSELARIGVELLHYPYVRDVKQYLKESATDFDGFILWRYNCGGRYIEDIRSLCGRVPVVLHTQDLHFLRSTREAELNGTTVMKAEELRLAKERELKVISLATETIVVSQYEYKFLRDIGSRASISVIPLIMEAQNVDAPPSDREGLVFIGSFKHPPNLNAIMWFLNEVWPSLLGNYPSLKLHIIGSDPPPDLNVPEHLGVIVHGHVPDLAPLLTKAVLSIAPLRYGAGIKGKIGTSMSFGLPVVATSIAAEGMGLSDGVQFLRADTAEEFVRAIARLIEDKALWKRLSAAGKAFIDKNYSTSVIKDQIVRALARAKLYPFGGICSIQGHPEVRRFLKQDEPETLCAVPDGANSSERILASVLARESGYPGISLRNIQNKELPRVAVWGDLPALKSSLKDKERVDELASAAFLLGRIPCSTVGLRDLGKLLSSVSNHCRRISIACPSQVGPGSQPVHVSELVKNLERSGWDVRTTLTPLKESIITKVYLVEALRQPPHDQEDIARARIAGAPTKSKRTRRRSDS